MEWCRLRVLLGLLGLTVLLGVAALPLRGQEGGVRRERIVVDGRHYWVHQVEKGESLYGICKRYGVSQSEVVGCNPELFHGLKKGQRIRIPIPADVLALEQEASQSAADVEYSLHVVTAGETLYSIARNYGVSVPSLRSANGISSDTLRAHSVLRIPRKGSAKGTAEGATESERQTPYALMILPAGSTLYSIAKEAGVSVEALKAFNGLTSDTIQAQRFIKVPIHEKQSVETRFYVAQPGDGIYGIARAHGITPSQIYAANPHLNSQELRVGDTVRIPSPEGAMAPNDARGVVSSANLEALCRQQAPYDRRRPLRVALILPFNIDARAVDSLRTDDAQQNATGEDRLKSKAGSLPVDERFLDFYRGVLMVLERYQLLGYTLELSVFDSQRSEAVVRSIVQSDTLRNMQLIIGPVYPKNVSIVGAYAAQYRISMVSPLSDKTSFHEANPNFYQANPSFYTQLRAMVRSLRGRGDERVILLKEESIEDWELGENLQLMLQHELFAAESGVEGGGARVHTVVVPKGRRVQERAGQLKLLLQGDGKRNTVLIPSNNEVFVTDAIGQLSALKKSVGCEIEVFGMPSWQKMLRVDFSQLVYLRTIIFSPFHIDYDSPLVRDFLDNYRALFRAEPTHYAYQGWDVSLYFINLLLKYGEDFRYCLPFDRSISLLQNCFHFEQSKEFGSYESDGVFLLRFDAQRGLVLERTLQGGFVAP